MKLIPLVLAAACIATPALADPDTHTVTLPDGSTLVTISDTNSQLWGPSSNVRAVVVCSPECAVVETQFTSFNFMSGVWGAVGEAARRPTRINTHTSTSVSNGSASLSEGGDAAARSDADADANAGALAANSTQIGIRLRNTNDNDNSAGAVAIQAQQQGQGQIASGGNGGNGGSGGVGNGGAGGQGGQGGNNAQCGNGQGRNNNNGQGC